MYKFSLKWSYFIEEAGLPTYADSFYVLNQIDLFWINSARKEIPVKEAMGQWGAFNVSALELGDAVKAVGDILLVFIKKHRLSYGEINQYLSHVRGAWVRSQLRAERKKPRKRSLRQNPAVVDDIVGQDTPQQPELVGCRSGCDDQGNLILV
jgi:hypothetical protein